MSTIKPRTATVPVYQGDDLERIAELRLNAQAARKRVEKWELAKKFGTARAGDAPSAKAEEAAYDAFVEEAAERAVMVEVHAIGRKRFRTLLQAHPPRQVDVTKVDDDGEKRTEQEIHPDDAGFNVNTETFPEALLLFVDRDNTDVRTIVSPEFATTDARSEFIDYELQDGDYEQVWQTAYYLNRVPGADPKASRYGSDSPRSTGI